MDTLKGNRRRATMTAATIKKELALAPAPVASDMVPLDMVAAADVSRLDGGATPLRASSHVVGQRPLI